MSALNLRSRKALIVHVEDEDGELESWTPLGASVERTTDCRRRAVK